MLFEQLILAICSLIQDVFIVINADAGLILPIVY